MTTSLTRREALSLLTALPFASSVLADTPADSLRRVFAGYEHGLLLEPDGSAKTWTLQISSVANNEFGCLGLGHDQSVPAATLNTVNGVAGVVTAALGDKCSAVLLGNGQLVTWGRNSSGQLGRWPASKPVERAGPAYAPGLVPGPVSGDLAFAAIALGDAHMVALTRDGSVYTWGSGYNGRLGVGPLPSMIVRTNAPYELREVPFPLRVPDLAGVKAIGAGREHSLAVMSDGSLRAWGCNKYGQLGDGTVEDRDRPVRVLGVENAVAVAAGFEQSTALLADGTVMTWGWDVHTLGRKSTRADDKMRDPFPARVRGAEGVRSLVMGRGHTLALTETGKVLSWGWTGHGESGLGLSGGAPVESPRTIGSLSNVRSIAAGLATSFAVLADGTIMTWGYVPIYKDSTGSRDFSKVPVRLELAGLRNP